MKYFTLFPKTTVNIDNKAVSMVDISVRVKLLDYIKNNQDSLLQSDYFIENEKRPEQVSYELYDSYNYTWTILILNNVYNIFEDWVLPQDVIDKRLIREYGSLEEANRKIVRWFDRYGNEVSSRSKGIASYETAFQNIMRENDKKKNIKVFSDISVLKIQNDFKRILKDA